MMCAQGVCFNKSLSSVPWRFSLGCGCGQPPVAGDIKGCQTNRAGGAGS